MSQIYLGQRNLLGNAAANTTGIWRLEDITQMRYYGFVGSSGGGSEIIVETFANTTTWTCPAGVTEVEYLVVAGGGGGTSNGYTPGASGGGGATAGAQGATSHATANTGSGSGGSTNSTTGNGGSGFIIIRYPIAS